MQSYRNTDLIFHLGLTKTASSLLQRKLFNGKINTMRRAVEWDTDRDLARAFQDLFRNSSPDYWGSSEGISFFGTFDPSPDMGPVIISHESLYEHVPFGLDIDTSLLKAEPALLAARLNKIKSRAWAHGETKAWFFFRRQSDWLASIYAHVCYRLKRPSQKDFVRRAKAFVDSRYSAGHVLDYAMLCESLEDALGASNVLALPYEAISEEWVWERIREFTGESALIRNESFDQRDVNVKRMPGESSWRVTEQAQPGHRLVAIGTRIGARRLPAGLRRRLRQLVTKSRREIRVWVPEELERHIMDVYRVSNNDLSRKTGVNLERYGYN